MSKVSVGPTTVGMAGVTVTAFVGAAVAFATGARDAVTISTLAAGVVAVVVTAGGRYAQATAAVLLDALTAYRKEQPTVEQAPAPAAPYPYPTFQVSSQAPPFKVAAQTAPGFGVPPVRLDTAPYIPGTDRREGEDEPPAPFTPDGDETHAGGTLTLMDLSLVADMSDTHGSEDSPA